MLIIKRGAYARTEDPETSHEAAEGVDVAELERRVYSALKLRGKEGATSHELSALTKIHIWSVSPRLKPLRRKNLVEDSGERRYSPMGKRCIVWRAI